MEDTETKVHELTWFGNKVNTLNVRVMVEITASEGYGNSSIVKMDVYGDIDPSLNTSTPIPEVIKAIEGKVANVTKDVTTKLKKLTFKEVR